MKKIGFGYLAIVPLVITVVLAAGPPTSYAAAEVVAWGSNLVGQTNVPPDLSHVIAIAAGDGHSVALTDQGQVVVWGNPGYGVTNVPNGLAKAVAIAAGGVHSLALTGQGQVVAWGSYAGSTPRPVVVPSALTNAVALAAGWNHDLALTAQGGVVAWGLNSDGQTNVPAGLNNVVAIAAGETFSLALTAQGQVVAWGRYHSGSQNVPYPVPSDLSNVVAIAAGFSHSLALTAQGTVVAWGDGGPGTSGYPNVGQATVPNGLSNVVAIAASGNTSLALTSQGEVVAWGDYSDLPHLFVPSGLSNVVAIAAGGAHSLALCGLPPGAAPPEPVGPPFWLAVAGQPFQRHILAKNSVASYGAIGLPLGLQLDANTGLVTGQPAQAGKYDLVLSATNAVGSDSWPVTLYVNSVAVPGIPHQELVLTRLGTPIIYPVQAYNGPESFQASGLPPGWMIDPRTGIISGMPTTFGEYVVSLVASNRYGVGTGSLSITISPVSAWGVNTSGQTNVPSGLTNVVAIAAGGYHSLALTGDGHVKAWGWDGYGQTDVPSDLSSAVAIAAGDTHSLALTADGQVIAWGQFYRDAFPAPNTVPARLTNVVGIAAGGNHSLALTAQGGVVEWGFDPGSPGYIPATVPNGLSNVVAIAAGLSYSLALTADGRVAQWPGQTNVPDGLSDVVAIAAGRFHSLALTADGHVVAWGNNYSGQTDVPSGLSNVVAIAAQQSYSLALTAEGQVLAWGKYYDGSNDVPLPIPSSLSNVAAIAAGGRHALALQGFPPGVAAPAHLEAASLVASIDQPFYHRITVLNGATTYGVTGLPAGLALNPSTGVITGQPSVGGRFDLVLSAANRVGSDSWRVTLYVNGGAVPGIASHGLVLGRLDAPFSYAVLAYNQPAWFGASGLPAGWSINAQTGIISGVPVEFGDYAVSLLASNRYGVGTGSLTISVPPVLGWTGSRRVDTASGLTDVVAIAAGAAHGLALTAAGRVVAWGDFSESLISVGQTEVPGGLSNVVAIAAGRTTSLALTREGRVVEWGKYFDWSQSQYVAPRTPSGLSNVIAIAAGGNHSLALLADGSLATWGTTSDWSTGTVPATIPDGLSNVVAIAAGDNHSLVLTAEGRVVAWGSSGQTSVPGGLTNVVAIAAGGDDSLVLTADGRVVGWGATPVPAGLSNVVAIAIGGGSGYGSAGCGGGLALMADGRVLGWGSYTPTMRTFPIAPVPSDLTNIVAVVAGGPQFGGPNCLAIKGLSPGLAAPAWVGPQMLAAAVGRPFFHRIMVRNRADTFGADGLPAGLVLDQRTGLITGLPEQTGKFDVTLSATNRLGSTRWTVSLFLNRSAMTPGITSNGVAPATLGFAFKYAVEAYNSPEWYGASGLPAGLAIDPLTGLISGVPAEAGDFPVTLAVSNRFGMATDVLTLEISPVVAWGTNASRLGPLPRGLSNVVAIAAGGSFNLALTAEGRVIGWGWTTPPGELTNAVGIAAGAQHALAATADGRVVAWGVNFHGQTSVPGGLSNVVAVAAGANHSLALTADGRVAAWGQNIGGETQVPTDLRSVVAIAAQMEQSVALTADGRVVAWGYNGTGQGKVISGLSNIVAIAPGVLAVTSAGQVVTMGARTGAQTAVFGGLSNIVAVASQGFYSLALTIDGRVVAWGDNRLGQTNVPAGLSNVVAVATGDYQGLALIRQPNLPSPRLQLSQGIADLQLQAQGAPGISCILLRASQLPGPWLPAQPVTFTNGVQWLRAPDMSEPAQFFRLLRK